MRDHPVIERLLRTGEGPCYERPVMHCRRCGGAIFEDENVFEWDGGEPDVCEECFLELVGHMFPTALARRMHICTIRAPRRGV